MCKNGLFGNILELHLIASFTGQCDYEDYMCKIILKEQIKNNLSQFLNNKIRIYFDDNRYINTSIKWCGLTDIIGKKKIRIELIQNEFIF